MPPVTIETNFNSVWHSADTAGLQKGVTSWGGWGSGRRRFVYLYRRALCCSSCLTFSSPAALPAS